MGLPPMSKCRTHSPDLKARVALEAISGRKTIQEIAPDQAIHPIQVSQWKRQPLDGAYELFTCGQQEQRQGRWPGQGGRAVQADRAVADGAGVAHQNLCRSVDHTLRKLLVH
ncbi:MAG: transposase [bacterium]